MLTLVRNSAIDAVCCSICGERMLQKPLSCLCIPGNGVGAKTFNCGLPIISWVACCRCNQIQVAIQHLDSNPTCPQPVDAWQSDGRSMRTSIEKVFSQPHAGSPAAQRVIKVSISTLFRLNIDS